MSTSLTHFEIYQLVKRSDRLTSQEAKALSLQPLEVAQVLLSPTMDEKVLEKPLYDLIAKDPNNLAVLIELPTNAFSMLATFYCSVYNTHDTWSSKHHKIWRTLIGSAYGYSFRFPEHLSFSHITHPLFLQHMDVIHGRALRNALSDIRNHRPSHGFSEKMTLLQQHIGLEPFQEYIDDAPQAWMLDCVTDPALRATLISRLSFQEIIESPYLFEIIQSGLHAEINHAITLFREPEQLKELFYQQWQGNHQDVLDLLPRLLSDAELQGMIPFADYPADVRYACWITSPGHIDHALALYPEYRDQFLDLYTKQCQNPDEHWPLESVLDPDYALRREQYAFLNQQHDFRSRDDERMSYNEMLLMYHGYVWPFGNYNKTNEVDLHFSL